MHPSTYIATSIPLKIHQRNPLHWTMKGFMLGLIPNCGVDKSVVRSVQFKQFHLHRQPSGEPLSGLMIIPVLDITRSAPSIIFIVVFSFGYRDRGNYKEEFFCDFIHSLFVNGKVSTRVIIDTIYFGKHVQPISSAMSYPNVSLRCEPFTELTWFLSEQSLSPE